MKAKIIYFQVPATTYNNVLYKFSDHPRCPAGSHPHCDGGCQGCCGSGGSLFFSVGFVSCCVVGLVVGVRLMLTVKSKNFPLHLVHVSASAGIMVEHEGAVEGIVTTLMS